MLLCAISRHVRSLHRYGSSIYELCIVGGLICIVRGGLSMHDVHQLLIETCLLWMFQARVDRSLRCSHRTDRILWFATLGHQSVLNCLC